MAEPNVHPNRAPEPVPSSASHCCRDHRRHTAKRGRGDTRPARPYKCLCRIKWNILCMREDISTLSMPVYLLKLLPSPLLELKIEEECGIGSFLGGSYFRLRWPSLPGVEDPGRCFLCVPPHLQISYQWGLCSKMWFSQEGKAAPRYYLLPVSSRADDANAPLSLQCVDESQLFVSCSLMNLFEVFHYCDH